MAPAALHSESKMTKDSRQVADLQLPDERRQRVVHARFTVSEFASLEHAAGSAEMTVSAFLRSLAMEGAGVRPFFSDDDRLVLEVLISDVRALGINLNQIARSVNGGMHPSGSELPDLLSDIQRLLAAVLLEMRRFAGRGRSRRRGGV